MSKENHYCDCVGEKHCERPTLDEANINALKMAIETLNDENPFLDFINRANKYHIFTDEGAYKTNDKSKFDKKIEKLKKDDIKFVGFTLNMIDLYYRKKEKKSPFKTTTGSFSIDVDANFNVDNPTYMLTGSTKPSFKKMFIDDDYLVEYFDNVKRFQKDLGILYKLIKDTNLFPPKLLAIRTLYMLGNNVPDIVSLRNKDTLEEVLKEHKI